MTPMLNLWRLALSHVYLLGWQWAEKEIDKTHADVPKIVHRQHELRRQIASLQCSLRL